MNECALLRLNRLEYEMALNRSNERVRDSSCLETSQLSSKCCGNDRLYVAVYFCEI